MVPTLWVPIGELLQNEHAVGLLTFLASSGRPSVVDATLPNDHRDDIPPSQRLASVADAFDSGVIKCAAEFWETDAFTVYKANHVNRCPIQR